MAEKVGLCPDNSKSYLVRETVGGARGTPIVMLTLQTCMKPSRQPR